MKFIGLSSRFPGAPKLPPGLADIMETLSREVIIHNPSEEDMHSFCAAHLKKLLELRDGRVTPAKNISLDEKIAIAQKLVKERAEKRWKMYDSKHKPRINVESTDSVEKTNESLAQPFTSHQLSTLCIPDSVKDNEFDLLNKKLCEFPLDAAALIAPVLCVKTKAKEDNFNENSSNLSWKQEIKETNVPIDTAAFIAPVLSVKLKSDEDSYSDGLSKENQGQNNEIKGNYEFSIKNKEDERISNNDTNINSDLSSTADTSDFDKKLILLDSKMIRIPDVVKDVINEIINDVFTDKPPFKETKIEESIEFIENKFNFESFKNPKDIANYLINEIINKVVKGESHIEETMVANIEDDKEHKSTIPVTEVANGHETIVTVPQNNLGNLELQFTSLNNDRTTIPAITDTEFFFTDSEIQLLSSVNKEESVLELKSIKSELPVIENIADDLNKPCPFLHESNSSHGLNLTHHNENGLVDENLTLTVAMNNDNDDQIKSALTYSNVSDETENVKNDLQIKPEYNNDKAINYIDLQKQKTVDIELDCNGSSLESFIKITENEINDSATDADESTIKIDNSSYTSSPILPQTDDSEHDVSSIKNKTMDLETAAITIQKVFRAYLFKSRASTLDDGINHDNSLEESLINDILVVDDIKSSKMPENVYYESTKDRRPLGLTRMDTTLQTVNEEKSLSQSTDDSSTLSSAATIIQAHIRGFLVRNKLHSHKTANSVNSDEPSSLEADNEINKTKTILNIHIVPEGESFLSRDESLASLDLPYDISPSASVNLHPLGYDKNERRKQLKREDAIQIISPPTINSGKLSEDVDSLKEVSVIEIDEPVSNQNHGDNIIDKQEQMNGNETNIMHKENTVETAIQMYNTSNEKVDETDLNSTNNVETVKEGKIDSSDSSITCDEAKVHNSNDFQNLQPESSSDSEVITATSTKINGKGLIHSSEFHDMLIPTVITRCDLGASRGE